MRFYDIVRLDNSGPEQDCFEQARKLLDRGWVNKLHDYLQDWNYGGENKDVARVYGTVRETVLDFPTDRIVKTFSCCGETFYVCTTDGRDSYEAVYLVGEYWDGDE